MCLTQLRLIAYMGGLELYFRSSSHHKGFDEEQTRETGKFFGLKIIINNALSTVFGKL